MLFNALKENKKLPFHMPGHKRNTNLLGNDLPYDIDITEIDGFDNLHCPTGLISDIEKKAEKIYNSKKSFLLVNGSTVGILAGINTVLNQNDVVLISRNCHKSVYNSVELVKAKVEYLENNVDEYGINTSVDLIDLKNKIEKYSPKLIVVASPTYEGVISDINSICEMAHNKNIPVMIDSAHGAHMFKICQESNADIIIMSLHKTLPALTQCALAHINGDLVDENEFRNKLSIFETSSPSYILLSSIEKCLDFIEEQGLLFVTYQNYLYVLHNKLYTLKNLQLLEYDDIGKLVIFTGNTTITGVKLADILRSKYNIEVEMASKYYIIAMTSVCDDFKNYNIFADALLEIDKTLTKSKEFSLNVPALPKKSCEAWKVSHKEYIDLDKSIGLICGEYIWAYPPGVPIIIPGEVISKDIVDYITDNLTKNINIQSTYGRLPEKICCKKV